MKNLVSGDYIYVVMSRSRVRGTNDDWSEPQMVYAETTQKAAEIDVKRLSTINKEEIEDKYLEFYYWFETIKIF